MISSISWSTTRNSISFRHKGPQGRGIQIVSFALAEAVNELAECIFAKVSSSTGFPNCSMVNFFFPLAVTSRYPSGVSTRTPKSGTLVYGFYACMPAPIPNIFLSSHGNDLRFGHFLFLVTCLEKFCRFLLSASRQSLLRCIPSHFSLIRFSFQSLFLFCSVLFELFFAVLPRAEEILS